MFYLWPEKISQDHSSNVSNFYYFNTLLHQGTLQGRQTTDKSKVLLPTSSKATSSVRWTVSLFNDASSHLLTDHNMPSSWKHQRQILQQIHKTTWTVQHSFHITVQLLVPQNVVSISLHCKHVLALERPLSRSQNIHLEMYAECNTIMSIQWEIIWHCTCKIRQNTPYIWWLRFKYLKFIHIQVFTK
jgi:hypothetical protein